MGHIQLANTFAYSFMEIIAERDLDGGRWEKTESGYRLVGSSTQTLPSAAGSLSWWLLALALGLIGAALYLFLGKRLPFPKRDAEPGKLASK